MSRFAFAIMLCGVLMACGPGGSSPPDHSNTGGAGGAPDNPPTGGSGGDSDGAGGDVGEGGVGGDTNIGGAGGFGGSIEPPPVETCDSMKSDGAMPTDNPCSLEGRWAMVSPAVPAWYKFDVVIGDDMFQITIAEAELAPWNSGITFSSATMPAELNYIDENDGTHYRSVFEIDEDGRLVETDFDDGQDTGTYIFRRE